ncbi:Methyltransferase domain-containing protein [Meinhardsimonia xiamenensis]|jgi:SAM-dependent methyltransferase|uniref:Methyltransferase domain-containing protein n=1 Tax=Meinhardsimonia xiamenensis TaxID=990712 RepID=A0A1G8YU57_9RHOB|nr:methyltransferase domain-containing protein [Meinhardsimonia xiamenensis]PRX37439.1 methyltransferase family protein [Meinhardsimonia xiamenensis]SDK06331.1 Methyltransferase domain-containing protein [Meinhardsimonia xiamenensis]
MHLDVLDLRTFYYRTGLGRAAQRAVRDQLLRLWPNARGQTVVGFGFAVPLLRPYLGEARRVIALMPGQQGVMAWPAGRPNVSVLCEETLWPLQTETADRVLMLHGLETSENPGRLLEECWRVLAPGGRAVFIVPNRGGLWSRSDATPFGFGRPYTLGQLEGQLRSHGFMPERHLAALFQPPSRRGFWLRSGGLVERIGQRFSPRFAGGALMVEASKQVVARPPGERVTRRRPLQVLEGIGQPEAKPV